MMTCLIMQQIRALLKNAGSSICSNDLDWFGIGGSVGVNTRNSEALSKFLQAQPSDFSTTRFQVYNLNPETGQSRHQ